MEQRRNEKLAVHIFRNLEQIITGSSSLKRSVDQVDHDDAEPLPPGPGTSTHRGTALLPFQDVASYRTRVKSYSPSMYFAKPLLLSPLICARFGWCCTGRDIIQCVDCHSVIAILFHPDLSPESYTKLALTYHKMLATSHKARCRFAMDATRWLLMNRNSGTSDKEEEEGKVRKGPDTLQPQPFVVPPYLIPMSKGFQAMEDCTESGFLTREYLRDKALAIVQHCKKYEIDPTRLQVPFSSDLLSRIKNVLCCAGLEASSSLDDVHDDHNYEHGYGHATLSILHDLFQKGDDMPLSYKPDTNAILHQQGEEEVHRQVQQLPHDIILLALFGWSIATIEEEDVYPSSKSLTTPSSSSSSQEGKRDNPSMASSLLVVSCPMCLCEYSIACVCYSTSSSSKSCSRSSSPCPLSNAHEKNDQHPPCTNFAKSTKNNEQQHHIKRRRLDRDGGDGHGSVGHASFESSKDDRDTNTHTKNPTDNPPSLFDLVSSHRHFCPMSNGFIKDSTNTSSSSTSRPGWEIYLMSLCRGIQETSLVQDGHHDDTTTTTPTTPTTTTDTIATSGRNVKGANLLEKIRMALSHSFYYDDHSTKSKKLFH